MPPLPPITQALVLINVAVYCLSLILGPWFSQYLALWPLGPHFFPWQVVTYSFLHDPSSMGHLFFNMLGLWMFGSELEQVWGPKRYLQYYFASVLAAAAAQLLLGVITGVPSPTVGASGGIYGLLLAFGMMFPNRTIVPLIPPIPMKARTFVLVFGALELIQGVFFMDGGIAHFAHLGGMLGGWLMIRYWRKQPPFGKH